MTTSAPIGCTHGRGFKCPVCWPHLQPSTKEEHVTTKQKAVAKVIDTITARQQNATANITDLEKKFRNTGRTTRLAVSYAQTALSQPGKELHIFDHKDEKKEGIVVTQKVADILRILGVQFEHKATSITVVPLEGQLDNPRTKDNT